MLFKNPVIPGYNPDPSICRVGDDFYLELQRHKATVPRANHETYKLQEVVNQKLV